MRKFCTVITHVEDDDLGILEEVFKERDLHVNRVYAGSAPLTIDSSLFIVLGGPMGSNEEHIYPFLKKEVSILQARIARQAPTLGICLGAQLLAKAAGALVYPQDRPEHGWNSIALTQAGKDSCLQLLADAPVFHWHSDTFDLPLGAKLLASSSLCKNQAFSLGKNILALQFHIEANLQKVSLFSSGISMIEGVEKRAKQTLHSWLDGIKN